MNHYEVLAPELVLLGLAFALVTLELLFPQLRKDLVAYLTAASAIGVLVASAFFANRSDSFKDLIQLDNYTTFFRILFLGTAALLAIASAHLVRDKLSNAGEYYGLLLLGVIGATYMAAASELLTAYIALELLNFTLYVLVSFDRKDPRSGEAGLKYILLSAFASALLLFGISFIFGVTGTTSYAGIRHALEAGIGEYRGTLVVGLVLLLTGLGFKVAAVPFHMWTPDAYEGAPLPVTAYISIVAKAAGFALFLRLFSQAFMPVISDWRWMVALLAALTMVFGNLIALQQVNIKRLLAYSSISQVGYMLIAIAALSHDSATALLLHLGGYAITNLAAFIAIIAFYNATGGEEIRDFRGLAERHAGLAMTLTIALFSLAGMPLFAGFMTKFILFQAAAQHGLLWLSAFGVVTSMISLYYYLMVIRQMYVLKPRDGDGRLRVPLLTSAVLVVLALGIFFVGIWPTPLFRAAASATRLLF